MSDAVPPHWLKRRRPLPPLGGDFNDSLIGLVVEAIEEVIHGAA